MAAQLRFYALLNDFLRPGIRDTLILRPIGPGQTEEIDPALVTDRVPARVRREQRDRRCPDCDGLYWKGSHNARMPHLVEASVGRSSSRDLPT